MGQHPLETLRADEITAAVGIVRSERTLDDRARFASITLDEPTKAELAAFADGGHAPRRVRLVVVPGPTSELIEAVVDLDAGSVEAWRERADTRPAILLEEAVHAMEAVRADADWQAAMIRRGITDWSQVQIDPWPAGSFGIAHETDRRIARCLSYFRETPTDNGYARPVEGVIAFVDLGRREVLEVLDHGTVPMPPERGGYFPDDVGPLRSDLKPVEITQPEGASFTVEGNLVRWQRWSFRVSMDPYEGLVLHTVGYEDDGRVRPILHRASVSEMVVPYGDPGPMHGWKNAFDVGEWGLGRMTNSLELGCDCVGLIHYFDVVFADEQGEPYTLDNAICMHEEDYGILWKHHDLHAGTTEVRRSRRLVVSFIATVGNYDYGFYWYFYLDGSIQLEVKLTGMLSTMAVEPGSRPEHASMVAPGLAGPYHQHLFNVRLDLDVDGERNTVSEIDVDPVSPGPEHPFRNAFVAAATPLATERAARRDVDPSRSRTWKIENPDVHNALGEPVAYKLVPGPSPTLLADPESSVARRAAFASHNVWVTPYRPEERRAAGEHPNQHAGGDGLPAWTDADRSIADTDVVVWHTFGVTHVPRPEDWPVMPVEYTGFLLVPFGFFDRNPALDLPPTPAHCHHEAT